MLLEVAKLWRVKEEVEEEEEEEGNWRRKRKRKGREMQGRRRSWGRKEAPALGMQL